MTTENLESWDVTTDRAVAVLSSGEHPVHPEFKDWFASKKDIGRVFDFILFNHAFGIYNKLKDDKDHFTVIVGKEGSGKSTLAEQLCAVVSSDSFCLKNICFNLKDFVANLESSQKGMSFQLDEGSLFLFSYSASSKDSVTAKKLFTVMRTKNLHTVICIPNFFTLDRYVRDHRVDTLIHVDNRGDYTAYTKEAIKIISKEGEKYKNIKGIRVPNGTFWQGHFRKDMAIVNDINPLTYREYKDSNINKFIAEIKNEVGTSEQADVPINRLPDMISVTQASKKLNICRDKIHQMINSGELPASKPFGSKWMIDVKVIEEKFRQSA